MFKKKPNLIETIEHLPFVSPEQFENIEENTAKFILEHSEKLLKETLDTNNVIVTRTTLLIGLVVSFLLAFIGFIVNRLDRNGDLDIVSGAAIVCFAYLAVVAYLLSNIIKPRNFKTIGAEPKPIFDSKLLKKKNLEQLKCLYINEIESYQDRITVNKKTNEDRWKIFTTCLQLVVFCPIFFVLIYFIVVLLSP